MRFKDIDDSDYFNPLSDGVQTTDWNPDNPFYKGKAPKIVKNSDFFDSQRWKDLRKAVLECYGKQCMKCETVRDTMQVDHIKSRFNYPELQWEFTNLQVLCRKCNQEKSIDTADYRKVKLTQYWK